MAEELCTTPQFDEAKATQAAAQFLKFAGGRLSYLKLIKLLYMLDRTSLERRGHAVTNDQYFSMKLGPVLSEVLDLITEPAPPGQSGFWYQHISEPANYEVSLEKDPGTGKLSEREEELIEEVYAEFGCYAPFDLVELLHKQLPEWTEVKSGRVRLPYADILKAVNKTPEEIAAIEEELSSMALVHSTLSSA